MATLANLVKNINPPRQMTWATYNALPFQVKIDGTQYYITDRDDAVQTAATTPALDKNGNSSNAQDELDSLNNIFDGVIYGPTEVFAAKRLVSPHQNGIYTDNQGNIVHKNSKASSNWHIDSQDGNLKAFQIYLQTGQMRSGNRTFCCGKGNTIQFTSYTGGLFSNSSKDLAFSIPCWNNAQNVALTKLTIVARSAEGIYPYMKYGNKAASSIQLGNTAVTLWNNSAEAYSKSISSIVLTNCYSYIRIMIHFVNPLVTTSGGTTNVKTNTPMALQIVATFSFT